MPSPHVPSRLLATIAAALLSLALSGCDSREADATVTEALVVTDLDGDGRLDVVGADATFHGALPRQGFLSSRLRGPVGGSLFLDPVRTAACAAPLALASGDLDGDGRPDLALACWSPLEGSYGVELFLQDRLEPGLFVPLVTLPLGPRQPMALALADFDGDGRLDLAVAALGDETLLLYLQDATGGFTRSQAIPLGAEPVALAAGDLAASGRQDLVVALRGGRLGVLGHAAAPGTFAGLVTTQVGRDLAAVAVADLHGDGRPDVLAADFPSGLVYWLRQAAPGSGLFASQVVLDTLDVGSLALAVGDLDGDGRLDLAVANLGPPGLPGTVSVFRQATQAGTLDPPVRYTALGPTGVALGDLDGDGRLDLVVTDGSPLVWPQDPATPGTFLAPFRLRQ
jgi:hypothetical protein